jgi:hypothetical protein
VARSNATLRAIAALERAIGHQSTKASKEEAACIKAMGKSMPRMLEAIEPDARAQIFFLLELNATTANAKKVATHRLRPVGVDEMLEEARAEAAAMKVEEDAAKAGAEIQARAEADAKAKDAAEEAAQPDA